MCISRLINWGIDIQKEYYTSRLIYQRINMWTEQYAGMEINMSREDEGLKQLGNKTKYSMDYAPECLKHLRTNIRTMIIL